jgi:hypothetical protein
MPEVIDSQPALQAGDQSVLKQFATKLSISIMLAIGLLAAGECIAYVLLPHQVSMKFEYKPYVVWQRAGGDGLRPTFFSHCGANEQTIWMFGSSSLWGASTAAQETIPSFVARHYEESGQRVCVKNFGQPGWSSTQELIKLLLELKQSERRPDVVIFYDGSADSYLPYDSDQDDAHMGYFRVKKIFESWEARNQAGFGYLRSTNSYLALQKIARKLKLVSDFNPPRSISPEQAASMAKFTLDHYLKNMEALDGLAAHYGFRYICFWEPWLGAAEKPLTPEEELNANWEAEQTPGETRMVAATYGLFHTLNQPHFFYLADMFKGEQAAVFVRASHLTAEGNRLVAERICQIVQHLGW